MNRVGLRGACGVDDPVDGQVTLGRSSGTEATGAIGEGDMLRAGVGVRVHGDALDAELTAGANDANGNLAPIRDEHAFQHVSRSILACACRETPASLLVPPE